MTEGRRAAARAGLAVLAVVIGLAVARPWTTRPIQATPSPEFDPRAYVSSIWTRVLEDAQRSAVDVAAALDAGTEESAGMAAPSRPRAIFVRGTGDVADVDRGSRVGLLRLRLEGVDDPGAAIQIGPVLRGTAVRDALEFVRFTDFANQSDFAAVAGALNDRVLQSVLGPIDASALLGKTVSFTGAAPTGGRRAGAPLEIVPLVLEVHGGER